MLALLPIASPQILVALDRNVRARLLFIGKLTFMNEQIGASLLRLVQFIESAVLPTAQFSRGESRTLQARRSPRGRLFNVFNNAVRSPAPRELLLSLMTGDSGVSVPGHEKEIVIAARTAPVGAHAIGCTACSRSARFGRAFVEAFYSNVAAASGD